MTALCWTSARSSSLSSIFLFLNFFLPSFLQGLNNNNNNNNNNTIQPIALETLGPINESAVEFVNTLGHRIAAISSDDEEGQFLYQ